MKLILKIFIITALLSCGASWGFKNYKNSLISSDSTEEVSSESKEKSNDEKDDSFANLNFENDLNLSQSISISALATEEKLIKFSAEVPTSPPNS